MYNRALAPRLSKPDLAGAKALDMENIGAQRRTLKRSRIACKLCRQAKACFSNPVPLILPVIAPKEHER